MTWRANSLRFTSAPRLLGFTVLLSWAATGCASQQFDGATYQRGDLSFAVGQPPSSWRAIEVSDALIAYRDDEAGATVAVNGRCGKDGDDVPLESLTQHLFIHFTDREQVEQNRVPMDGREAMRTEMFAKLDGVRQGFVVYVLKKDGCVYDFLYISEPNTLDSGSAQFDRYVSGFRTMPH